jgi:hypothetical protein
MPSSLGISVCLVSLCLQVTRKEKKRKEEEEEKE